jgi:hypothetical protein
MKLLEAKCHQLEKGDKKKYQRCNMFNKWEFGENPGITNKEKCHIFI